MIGDRPPLARLIALVLFSFPALATADPIKVACVGDSITLGVGVANPDRDSYPARLGRILGGKYEVRNFGFSGATALTRGNNPYRKTSAFRDATRFRPDVVIILLGTNDSKTRNWDGRAAEFGPDYADLVAHFAKLNRPAKILVGLPPPAFRADGDIRERILVKQRRILRELAGRERRPVIDLASLLRRHPEAFADGIHPNKTGANLIAEAAALAIRQ